MDRLSTKPFGSTLSYPSTRSSNMESLCHNRSKLFCPALVASPSWIQRRLQSERSTCQDRHTQTRRLACIQFSLRPQRRLPPKPSTHRRLSTLASFQGWRSCQSRGQVIPSLGLPTQCARAIMQACRGFSRTSFTAASNVPTQSSLFPWPSVTSGLGIP